LISPHGFWAESPGEHLPTSIAGVPSTARPTKPFLCDGSARRFAPNEQNDFSISIRYWEGETADSSASPDFLLNLMALANFMRLSLLKGAPAALSSAAWQEIRVRSE